MLRATVVRIVESYRLSGALQLGEAVFKHSNLCLQHIRLGRTVIGVLTVIVPRRRLEAVATNWPTAVAFLRGMMSSRFLSVGPHSRLCGG